MKKSMSCQCISLFLWGRKTFGDLVTEPFYFWFFSLCNIDSLFDMNFLVYDFLLVNYFFTPFLEIRVQNFKGYVLPCFIFRVTSFTLLLTLNSLVKGEIKIRSPRERKKLSVYFSSRCNQCLGVHDRHWGGSKGV